MDPMKKKTLESSCLRAYVMTGDLYQLKTYMSFIVLILSIHNAGGRHSEHHLDMLGILDLELPVGVQETQS